MDHYENVNSDVANAYLKHMCQILSVYITQYTCNECIQTVNGEKWKTAAFVCVVNVLTQLLLATWLENVRNLNRANKPAVRMELSLRCSYFWGVVLCHWVIGTERFETA
jgi:pyruvate-formate lyase